MPTCSRLVIGMEKFPSKCNIIEHVRLVTLYQLYVIKPDFPRNVKFSGFELSKLTGILLLPEKPLLSLITSIVRLVPTCM